MTFVPTRFFPTFFFFHGVMFDCFLLKWRISFNGHIHSQTSTCIHYNCYNSILSLVVSTFTFASSPKTSCRPNIWKLSSFMTLNFCYIFYQGVSAFESWFDFGKEKMFVDSLGLCLFIVPPRSILMVVFQENETYPKLWNITLIILQSMLTFPIHVKCVTILLLFMRKSMSWVVLMMCME